jgi:CRISPR-associated protein Cmr1
MRTPKSGPAPVLRKSRHSIERRYQFLTHVFGGGVKVRDHEKFADPVTPVRVASVRGQLRFWWRACNPSQCQTLDELRQRESLLWGSTSQPAAVEIVVSLQPSRPNEIPVFEYNANRRLVSCRGMREIAYGAFPLQPSRDAQRLAARPGVLFDYGDSQFVLRFSYPEGYQHDVETALWAWETFGGLGGRTRRGFGAVTRVDAPRPSIAEVTSKLSLDNPCIPGVPSLSGARWAAARNPNSSALDAWKNGLQLLQQIRQGSGFGRFVVPAGSTRPAGRSRWQEPDEIRRLTRQSAPSHARPAVAVRRFPRAAFGMPIVFHFNPGSVSQPGSMGDPDMRPLHLQPIGFERFASPLILRPFAEGASFRTVALALASPIPDAELVAGGTKHPADWRLDPELAARIPALTRPGKVYEDPIELFIRELEK